MLPHFDSNMSERERMKQMAREKLEARRRNMQAQRDAQQELMQEERDRQVEEANVAEDIDAQGMAFYAYK